MAPAMRPPPDVPRSMDSERFDKAFRKMFTLSKGDLLKGAAKWCKARAGKKRAKRAV